MGEARDQALADLPSLHMLHEGPGIIIRAFEQRQGQLGWLLRMSQSGG